MIGDIPVLRSLDPYHQRIGYLGLVALKGIRDLDTPEALNARVDEMLFEKFYAGTSAHTRLWSLIPPRRQEKLLEEAAKRDPEEDPSAILRPLAKNGEWFNACELWINDQRMPSNVGPLNPKKSHRIIDFARMVELLLPTYELSEIGHLLQVFLLRDGAAEGNPLIPRPSTAVHLIYQKILLDADCVWPVLLQTMAEDAARGEPLRSYSTDKAAGLLNKSVDRLLERLAAESGIDDINQLRPLREYLESIRKSSSTEENYLRPRMELLLDLGLINRTDASKEKVSKKEFVWALNDSGTRMASLLEPIAYSPDGGQVAYRQSFFSIAAKAHNYHVSGKAESDAEMLYWFSRAFKMVGREYGFTPGKTIAFTACLLAIERGRLLEVSSVSDCVYRAAKNEFSQFLKFSGGSRFDREFLIRVQPGLEAYCIESCKASGVSLSYT